jgi:hypothetical protein
MYSLVVAFACVDQLVAAEPSGLRNTVDFACMNVLQCYVGFICNMYSRLSSSWHWSRSADRVIGGRLIGRWRAAMLGWCVARGMSDL